jgi:hypothetical protein
VRGHRAHHGLRRFYFPRPSSRIFSNAAMPLSATPGIPCPG